MRLNEPDDDPLWYDAAEPEVPPGRLLLLIAAAYVAGRTLVRLPGAVCEACLAGRAPARRPPKRG
ncbi:hypothetical protein [Methylobacterium planeticum]|uniref:Uncharacterized protein n=1 Tax=Methylobacterium planeticum TaxID=2615211 RepID=A0A6N6ML57_9HYPH|nr:hypothetical protein [Methylobacterium planeticum]KAB1070459.1 hypothetical protein F6X51_22250 [Methylobacterium planeticum]